MEDESDLTGATPRRRPKPDVLEIGGRRLKPSTLMMGHGYRSGAVRRLAEAADLPDLDLRLRERRGRQAPLRGRHRQAAGRRRGPGLFALQRPQPGDPRGPAQRLGGCRGRAELLVAACRRSPPCCSPSSSPATSSSIRGRSTPRPRRFIGRILGRFGVNWLDFPAGATERGDRRGDRPAPRRWAGSRSSISKARPTRPTRWSTSRRCAARATPPSRDERAADRDRQHLPRPALAPAARATAPTSSVYSLTKYAGGHQRPRRRRRRRLARR